MRLSRLPRDTSCGSARCKNADEVRRRHSVTPVRLTTETEYEPASRFCFGAVASLLDNLCTGACVRVQIWQMCVAWPNTGSPTNFQLWYQRGLVHVMPCSFPVPREPEAAGDLQPLHHQGNLMNGPPTCPSGGLRAQDPPNCCYWVKTVSGGDI